MPNMLRNVLTVFAGMVVAGARIALARFPRHPLFAPARLPDMSDPQAVRALVAALFVVMARPVMLAIRFGGTAPE
ncbi:MAG: hypothetical protein ABI790_01285 [Betaproteobacteria bacterium]